MSDKIKTAYESDTEDGNKVTEEGYVAVGKGGTTKIGHSYTQISAIVADRLGLNENIADPTMISLTLPDDTLTPTIDAVTGRLRYWAITVDSTTAPTSGGSEGAITGSLSTWTTAETWNFWESSDNSTFTAIVPIDSQSNGETVPGIDLIANPVSPPVAITTYIAQQGTDPVSQIQVKVPPTTIVDSSTIIYDVESSTDSGVTYSVLQSAITPDADNFQDITAPLPGTAYLTRIRTTSSLDSTRTSLSNTQTVTTDAATISAGTITVDNIVDGGGVATISAWTGISAGVDGYIITVNDAAVPPVDDPRRVTTEPTTVTATTVGLNTARAYVTKGTEISPVSSDTFSYSVSGGTATVQFDTSSATVYEEGASRAAYTVKLALVSGTDTSFTVNTSISGLANPAVPYFPCGAPGGNYIHLSETLTIPAGDTEVSSSFELLYDDIGADTKEVALVIDSTSLTEGATVGPIGTKLYIITGSFGLFQNGEPDNRYLAGYYRDNKTLPDVSGFLTDSTGTITHNDATVETDELLNINANGNDHAIDYTTGAVDKTLKNSIVRGSLSHALNIESTAKDIDIRNVLCLFPDEGVYNEEGYFVYATASGGGIDAKNCCVLNGQGVIRLESLTADSTGYTFDNLYGENQCNGTTVQRGNYISVSNCARITGMHIKRPRSKTTDPAKEHGDQINVHTSGGAVGKYLDFSQVYLDGGGSLRSAAAFIAIENSTARRGARLRWCMAVDANTHGLGMVGGNDIVLDGLRLFKSHEYVAQNHPDFGTGNAVLREDSSVPSGKFFDVSFNDVEIYWADNGSEVNHKYYDPNRYAPDFNHGESSEVTPTGWSTEITIRNDWSDLTNGTAGYDATRNRLQVLRQPVNCTGLDIFSCTLNTCLGDGTLRITSADLVFWSERNDTEGLVGVDVGAGGWFDIHTGSSDGTTDSGAYITVVVEDATDLPGADKIDSDIGVTRFKAVEFLYMGEDGVSGYRPSGFNTGTFSFIDQVDVTASAKITAQAIIWTGADTSAMVLSGAASSEYSINSGSWLTADVNVDNGDSIEVRHDASALELTATGTVLTIAGFADTFASTTEAGGTYMASFTPDFDADKDGPFTTGKIGTEGTTNTLLSGYSRWTKTQASLTQGWREDAFAMTAVNTYTFSVEARRSSDSNLRMTFDNAVYSSGEQKELTTAWATYTYTPFVAGAATVNISLAIQNSGIGSYVELKNAKMLEETP